jgi:hypothetical protein
MQIADRIRKISAVAVALPPRSKMPAAPSNSAVFH